MKEPAQSALPMHQYSTRTKNRKRLLLITHVSSINSIFLAFYLPKNTSALIEMRLTFPIREPPSSRAKITRSSSNSKACISVLLQSRFNRAETIQLCFRSVWCFYFAYPALISTYMKGSSFHSFSLLFIQAASLFSFLLCLMIRRVFFVLII